MLPAHRKTAHTFPQNLVKLASYGFLDGFYYKPRIDKELLRKLVQYGFACLNTKQNVMRLRILLVNIMAVVCRNRENFRTLQRDVHVP